jgi:nucleotide-binding universal stress UspA family protein
VQQQSRAGTANPDAVFDVVLVGVDDTPESLVAAVQANVLRPAASRLVLVGVAERYLAAHAGLAARHASMRLATSTSDDLARAERLVNADETVVADGRLVPVLRAEGARRDATLLAVGGRPHGRLRARTLGGHDEEALADASCSVLLARSGWGPRRPDRVIVCAGASPGSRYAGDVAARLAERTGSELLAVVGLDDEPDLDVVARAYPDALLDPGSQVDAVAQVATPQDLVVGSSVDSRAARRLAYGVRCSVLLVHHDADAAAVTA